MTTTICIASKFLSTLSLRRATGIFMAFCVDCLFLSTLSLRRATKRLRQKLAEAIISIHALLAESDTWARGSRVTYVEISIHALLAESDLDGTSPLTGRTKFLSTLSLRRATRALATYWTRTAYFYPRSPCGERRRLRTIQHPKINISIHALLAESDWCFYALFVLSFYFYPRSPCGERQGQKLHHPNHREISIHALLAESDNIPPDSVLIIDISIHALLAESDLTVAAHFGRRKLFLSTLSLRRATSFLTFEICVLKISIHALLAESDFSARSGFCRPRYFYPRSPCGERQPALYQLYDTYAISIHALLAESDIFPGRLGYLSLPFLSTLSLRRATLWGWAE